MQQHFFTSNIIEALHDADIILIPGYIPFGQDLGIYKAELRTIAYQNCLYVGMCNRVGTEDGMEYLGKSILAGPDGEIITEGSNNSELVVCKVDLADIRNKRNQNPYFTLRRPDEYLHIIKHV